MTETVFNNWLMPLTLMLTGILVIAAPLDANANSASKIYLAGYMGLNLAGDQDFSDKTNIISGSADIDNAPAFAGAMGLRLGKNVRAEAEISYRNNDINALSGNFGSVDVGGDISSWMGMVNLYYDFDVDWKIKPYVSAGLGLGYFDGEITSINNTRFQDEAYGLTWQAGAGLQYRASDKWAWTAGYRYLDSADLEFGDLDLDYGSHEIRIGLTYDLDWQ